MTQLVILPTKSARNYPLRSIAVQALELPKIAESLKTNHCRESKPTL